MGSSVHNNLVKSAFLYTNKYYLDNYYYLVAGFAKCSREPKCQTKKYLCIKNNILCS